ACCNRFRSARVCAEKTTGVAVGEGDMVDPGETCWACDNAVPSKTAPEKAARGKPIFIPRAWHAILSRPGHQLVAKGSCYAGTRHYRTGSRRRERGQIAIHTSRRICPRRNGTHPRRGTWRAIAGAGHCHWLVEGAACRCGIAPAAARPETNAKTGPARSRQGQGRHEAAIAHAFARDHTRAAPRRR